VVAYGRLNAKENFKLLALKVAAVAYKRWSLANIVAPNIVAPNIVAPNIVI